MRRGALDAGLFEEVTSVMKLDLVLGTMAAAGLAGRRAPSFRIAARALVAALPGSWLGAQPRPRLGLAN